MRRNDKLIRQNCPCCDAEITLIGSTRNKKFHCPKCRQLVILPEDATPRQPEESQPDMVNRSEPHIPKGLPSPDYAGKASEDSASAPKDENRESVIYCLCKGALKRRKISAFCETSADICCMCAHEAS